MKKEKSRLIYKCMGLVRQSVRIKIFWLNEIRLNNMLVYCCNVFKYINVGDELIKNHIYSHHYDQ